MWRRCPLNFIKGTASLKSPRVIYWHLSYFEDQLDIHKNQDLGLKSKNNKDVGKKKNLT